MKELEKNELMGVDGGFLPLIAIYACWGVMAGCSAIALGMREALRESQR
jgi:lactobin A/cerein 7B family class IIb bacteriocin